MVLRVNTFPITLSSDRLDEFSRIWQDNFRQSQSRLAGLTKIYLVADREQGAVKIVGLWESHGAMTAAEPVVAEVRQQVARAMSVAPSASPAAADTLHQRTGRPVQACVRVL